MGLRGWATATVFSVPTRPLHEHLCLSTGPWTPTLETPVPQGGWLAESDKKTPQGALSMLVYTLWFICWSVINVFATK